jgi:hypothetical protein
MGDVDRFILSQREVIEAVVEQEQRKERLTKIGEDIAAWVYRVRTWCVAHPVASCVVGPRTSDLLVVVTAKGEDPDGTLHDAMSALDLESFQKNGLALSWILLRASEAEGLSAFIEAADARTIYGADQA